MTEKEIRERVERFLRRTAEAVVVPATMGLGMSQAGCDHHSLEAHSADAGAEVRRSDTAVNSDLPDPLLPYLVMMPPDAADSSSALPDTGPEAKQDLGSEAQSEAGTPIDAGDEAPARTDVSSDLPFPPPPYLAPPPPPDPPSNLPDARPDTPDARPDAPDARPDVPDARPDTLAADALPPPPPPYMVPLYLPPPGQSKK